MAALDSQAPTELLGAKMPARNGADPMIGREVIGQYRIEKKLGVGGMGAVYLAQQISVARPAVIKVLRSQLDGSSEGTSRFAVEAKAASSLNHPNIVTIYNYGTMDDGTLFLAMEYIEGETLAQRIERCGALPADRAVHIATQIARALGEAHVRGIIHRDLKPANVMLVDRVGEPDFVKVLDFGIAKIDDAGVTTAGYVVGTLRYMSPEQLLGKRLDLRSDIYSVGVVLYEMLAGVAPFSSDTPVGWVHQHVDVAAKPPSAVVKGSKISPTLDGAVLHALAKIPSDRPPSMEMFALELVAALNAPTEPSRWRRGVVATSRALVAGAWKITRAIGSGTWRLLQVIGSGLRRGARSTGSGTRRFLRTVGSGTRRAARSFRVARPRRAVAPSVLPVGMLATPARRLLLALLVVLAFAGLLAALFPEVRSDFGLGGDDRADVSRPAKRHHVPARARPGDKEH